MSRRAALLVELGREEERLRSQGKPCRPSAFARALMHLSAAKKGMRVTELAKALDVTVQAALQALHRMHSEGLVEASLDDAGKTLWRIVSEDPFQ